MSDPLSPEILARYFAGETTAEERRDIETWAAAADANLREFERLRQVWTATVPRQAWDVDHAWGKVSAHIVAPRLLVFPDRKQWRRRALQIAALVALIAGV